MQNGHVLSSIIACVMPEARTSSRSSEGAVTPSKVVNGIRSGLVTGSLASARLILCVATAMRIRSLLANCGEGRFMVRARPNALAAPTA